MTRLQVAGATAAMTILIAGVAGCSGYSRRSGSATATSANVSVPSLMAVRGVGQQQVANANGLLVTVMSLSRSLPGSTPESAAARTLITATIRLQNRTSSSLDLETLEVAAQSRISGRDLPLVLDRAHDPGIAEGTLPANSQLIAPFSFEGAPADLARVEIEVVLDSQRRVDFVGNPR